MYVEGETPHIVIFGFFKTDQGEIKSLTKPVLFGLISNQILPPKQSSLEEWLYEWMNEWMLGQLSSLVELSYIIHALKKHSLYTSHGTDFLLYG